MTPIQEATSTQLLDELHKRYGVSLIFWKTEKDFGFFRLGDPFTNLGLLEAIKARMVAEMLAWKQEPME